MLLAIGNRAEDVLMNPNRYPKAPIVEAVIDIHVRFETEATLELFDGFQQAVADRFPTKLFINQVQVGMAADADHVHVQSGQTKTGLRLQSVQNDRVLQIQKHSFTFSHLPPYSDWDTFRREARELWTVFLEQCRPVEISRVAVRFVNRIVIPHERIELEDYFNLYPKFPLGIPQDVSGMFMQFLMPQPDLDSGALAVINMAIEPPATPQAMGVLLDFDVYCQTSFPPGGEDVWNYLDRLRERKNLLFEASITDMTRGLFV